MEELVNVLMLLFIVQPCCISVIPASVPLQVYKPLLSVQDGEISADSSKSLCLFACKE